MKKIILGIFLLYAFNSGRLFSQGNVTLTTGDPPPTPTPTQVTYSHWIDVDFQKLSNVHNYNEPIDEAAINAPYITNDILEQGAVLVLVYRNFGPTLPDRPTNKSIMPLPICDVRGDVAALIVDLSYDKCYANSVCNIQLVTHRFEFSRVFYIKCTLEIGKIRLTTTIPEVSVEGKISFRYVIIPGEVSATNFLKSDLAVIQPAISDISDSLLQAANLNGSWQYKMTSMGGTVQNGNLILIQAETEISGEMSVTDKTQTHVTASFDGTTFLMSRITGLETTQMYSLTKKDNDHFSGTYHNEGKYPDSGTMEFHR